MRVGHNVGHVLPSTRFHGTNPSMCAAPRMWDASHMSADEETRPSRLQLTIRQAIADSGKARDHLDRLLQKKLGTKGKPLYDIDRGKSKNPSGETLKAIAEVFGQPLSHFTGEVEGGYLKNVPANPAGIAPDIPPTRTVDGGETVPILRLDLRVSMGPGTTVEGFVEGEPVEFDLGLLRSITHVPPGKLRIIEGIGDSMFPTLQGGDQVLIDISERAYSRIDGIYWIDHLGAQGIKRLRAASKGRILIQSDNPTVKDYEVEAEDLRIHGRAIWFARGL